jgi:capsular exopolysaccharide synthesis family protein
MEDTQARILSGEKRVKEIETAMDGSLSATKMLELQTEKTNLERLIADHVLNYVELSNLAAQDRTPNSLSVIETAHSGKDPIRPRVNLNILLGAGLGMLLALGIIFLSEFLNDSIKSTDDLSQFDKLNILGTFGRIKGKTDSEKIVTHLEPSSPTMESFRMIRNKIRLGSVENPPKSIVVTSPEPEEGKSVTAANLGVIMAQANIKTIIVDADLRHPVLHQVFKVLNKSGLSDLLASPEIDIQKYLKNTSINNLKIITSGESSQDQSELLRSERISEILKCLEEKADVIIIDSPPALLTADATILSNRADGVILVLRAGKTRRKALRQTLVDLEEANANILGCIYNQIHKDNNLATYKRRKQERS